MSFTSMACSDEDSSSSNVPEYVIPETSVVKSVTINPEQRFQTIDGFGASDCWASAYIGKKWKSSREDIAKLLFSTDIKDGQPAGIGLTQWRVNMGGGTIEQGDASGIEDKSRRAESFLTDNLTLDWNKCEGQRYFMSEAKKWGCPEFILFSNTPPVQYTYNGKGYSDRGAYSNLKPEYYDDFARYMADITERFLSEGYNISHISPVNEPQWNWNGHNQEGTGWTNDEVAKISRLLDTELTNRGLNTDILLSEAGDWQYLYKQMDDGSRSNQLKAFFTADSPNYLGNLSHVKKLICGHSYWTDSYWDGMRNVRKQVDEVAKKYGVKIWQSEWSMMGDGYSNEFIGYNKASQMDIALYMSKVIHNDLTLANVSSWSFWTAMDMPRWGHKNRFLLVTLLPEGEIYGDIDIEGIYQPSATLWALGNYSRFIRPGYQRIAMDLSESRFFFGSTWISPEGDKIVSVYSNLSEKAVRLNEEHLNWSNKPQSVITYTTSDTKSLCEVEVPESSPIIVDAKSVTTVVYNFKHFD